MFLVQHDGGKYVLKMVPIEARERDAPDIIVPRSGAEQRTRREVALMGSVTSENLPALGPRGIFEYSKDGLRFLGFTEEYVGDYSVAKLIKSNYFDSIDKVKLLARDVVCALIEYSNFEKGFVHRDVKPGNIVKRDNSDRFVLIDGGIHLLPSNPTITLTGLFVGTYKYASPEQLDMGRRLMDMRSDIFSLGVVIYEAATGHHPFFKKGEDPELGFERLRDAVYDPIADNHSMHALTPLLSRMLTRRPHTRYSSLEDLKSDIEEI